MAGVLGTNFTKELLVFDYYWLASSYTELGQYEKAIEAYKEALKLKPDNLDVYTFLAFDYRRTSQYEKAIELYKEIIKHKPDDASAYTGLGYAYMGLKQYEKAIEAFKKAISINPEAYYDIGFAYFDMKQYDNAIQSFKEAIKFKPEDADLHYTFATIYSSIGKLNDAITQLKIAQSIYNKSSNKAGEAKCLDAMGRASSKLNKDIDALNYFQKALTIYNELSNMKEVANMFESIAQEYSGMDEHIIALKYYQKAFEIYKQLNDVDKIQYLPLIINDLSGNYEELIKYSEDSLKTLKEQNLQDNPNAIIFYYALTLSYGEAKDYDKALEYTEKMLSISNQYGINDFMALSLFYLGAIYSEKDNYQQALVYIQKAFNVFNEITSSILNRSCIMDLGI